MNSTRIAIVLMAVFLVATAFARSTMSRAAAEIAALSAALMSYEADHGHYPSDRSTRQLDPKTAFDPSLYIPASRLLYRELSGDSDGDPSTTSPNDKKRYFEFRPQMLQFFGSRKNTYIADPWGNSYGYSTFKSAHPNGTGGYNLPFDLRSTGGSTTSKGQTGWTQNW